MYSFIKIASVACLNPKRLTLRTREIAGDIYDQQIMAFVASSQKGFLAAKASDDWTKGRHTYFLELIRFLAVRELPNGDMAYHTIIRLSVFSKV